jgi:hypothetical protein
VPARSLPASHQSYIVLGRRGTLRERRPCRLSE